MDPKVKTNFGLNEGRVHFFIDRHVLSVIDLCRYPVVQSLMGPFPVEEVEVLGQALIEQGDGGVVVDVDVFVFDRSPEPLDENIVHSPAPAVHADFYAILEEAVSEPGGGKLAALVGVENFGSSDGEGVLKRLDTKIGLQCVGQAPGQHIPAVPVHHGDQVHKPVYHADIGDVRAPDLIGTVDGQPPQQVGINAVLGMWFAGVWAWVNGFNTHFSHQTLNPFAVYGVSQFFQCPGHTTRSIEGGFGVLLIDQTHQQQIQRAFLGRLVVVAGPGKSNQPALAAQADVGMIRTPAYAGVSRRFSSTEGGSFFFQPVQFDLQPTNFFI